MGFVRKVVGNITGANQAAAATTAAADQQASATREAAAQTARANQEAAAQTARAQELAAQRIAAQGAAADTLATPIETPDVQLGTPAATSASASVRKRRATFGVGSAGTGVNI